MLREPRPFVWQTALNDFYVTYEINAYTDTPREMIDIYAALHAQIQDAFSAAGVEIMSPQLHVAPRRQHRGDPGSRTASGISRAGVPGGGYDARPGGGGRFRPGEAGLSTE